MKYLDYGCMPTFLRKYFQDEVESGRTSVGIGRKYQSGYFDIVRFYGEGGVDPRSVGIKYLTDKLTLIDHRIAEFARFIERCLIEEGRLYEGPPIMGLADYDFITSPRHIVVRETRYGDQAGTCFALDYSHPLFAGYGGTLREYYKKRCPSHAIKDSPLALCLGVCGLLLLEEDGNKLVLKVRRSRKLASLENSVGPSAAGSTDYKTTWRNLGELTDDSMSVEVQEELGLAPVEFRVIPLAFAREIFRGESPQLFCLIKTDLSRQEVSSRLETLAAFRREFDEFSFVELKKSSDEFATEADKLGLNHEATMNYYLLEEYLWQD